MKMTDESVAKALGWKAVEWRKNSHGGWGPKGLKPGGTKTPCAIPAFTTSLDAIVGEIEARGLAWNVGGGKKSPHYLAWVQEYGAAKPLSWGDQLTAPLALCAALLAYLKEPK